MDGNVYRVIQIPLCICSSRLQYEAIALLHEVVEMPDCRLKRGSVYIAVPRMMPIQLLALIKRSRPRGYESCRGVATTIPQAEAAHTNSERCLVPLTIGGSQTREIFKASPDTSVELGQGICM